MDCYTRRVIYNIPDLLPSDRLYLIIAYNECNEEFIYYRYIFKDHFSRSTQNRIEDRLKKKGFISSASFKKGIGLMEINHQAVLEAEN